MMNKIKKIIVSIMVSACAALMLLAIYAEIIDGKAIRVHTFFEIFGASVAVHLGFILTGKFESTYAVLEFLLDLSYMIVVLVTFGIIFDWYSSIPVWYHIIMAVAIYVFGVIINIYRTKQKAEKLNKLLQKRKEKISLM